MINYAERMNEMSDNYDDKDGFGPSGQLVNGVHGFLLCLHYVDIIGIKKAPVGRRTKRQITEAKS